MKKLNNKYLNHLKMKNLVQNESLLHRFKTNDSTGGKEFSGFIILNLSDKYSYFEGKELKELVEKFKLTKLRGLLDRSKPSFVRRQIKSASIKELSKLEKTGRNSDFPMLRSLSNYWRLDYRNYEGNIDELIKEFNSLYEINFAYKEHTVTDPFVNPSNDNLSAQQGYLGAAPTGIDAIWAWGQGFEGQGIGFIDLEQGWIPTHEDLAAASPTLIFNDNRSGVGTYIGDHGTAVLGEVVGVDNTAGIVGIAPSIAYVRMASHYEASSDTALHVADAIVAAILNMNVGDVLLLEVQRNFLPTEMDMADFDAIRLAVANGIIVVEAAGNGNRNLDSFTDVAGNFRLNRTHADFMDSGAIMVGASLSALPHNRWASSNFGSRIDCYGWGENIVTSGYANRRAGSLGNDLTATMNDDYTSTFGGTSGASPMITGAALILQGAYKDSTGTILSPLQMRSLLSNSATGTAQGTGVSGNIGVMPNLRAILEDTLEITPDIYLRDNVGDTGIVPSSGSISASPDIIARPNPVADPTTSFGEGSGTENSSTLGYEVESGQDNYIYVRMKNRGFTAANGVTAQVYWSEVSTLVTPNLWNLIGTSGAVNVPVGDTMVVTDPIVWDKNDIPATGHYCFVGLINHLQDGAPPLPPATNFDWDDFRAFVRNNNNATWRNFNVINVEADDPIFEMPINIVGSPDRERPFDIEIVRNLPKSANVSLQVPYRFYRQIGLKGLKAKIDKKSQTVTFQLPNLKTFYLCNLKLGKQIFKCKFIVKGNKEFRRGTHHFYIRQLYKKEEVGRVTWAFKNKKENS